MQIPSAKLDLALRKIHYQAVCKKIKKEIVQAKQNAILAQEKIESSKLSLELNHRLVDVMENNLRTGRATQIDCRDAIRKDLIAQYEYLKTQIDFIVKVRIWDFYMRK